MVELPTITTMEELASAQREDEELRTLLDSNTSLILRKFILSGTGSSLYCDCSTDVIRPFVPKALRRKIFEAVHNLAHPSGKACFQQADKPKVRLAVHG